jgi:hypothetical protein
MAFVDMTKDNISELMKSKDGKSTQRAVTRALIFSGTSSFTKMNLRI